MVDDKIRRNPRGPGSPFGLGHYKLNPDHSVEPFPVTDTASLVEWARQFESVDRQVAYTQVGPGLSVSTIFLALDHSFFEGPPLLFETMVFDDYGSGDCYRYSTWDEAMAGHISAVAKLEASLTPELKAQLEALAAMPDSEIDTSDIPETKDFSGFERGRFNRPKLRPKYD